MGPFSLLESRQRVMQSFRKLGSVYLEILLTPGRLQEDPPPCSANSVTSVFQYLRGSSNEGSIGSSCKFPSLHGLDPYCTANFLTRVYELLVSHHGCCGFLGLGMKETPYFIRSNFSGWLWWSVSDYRETMWTPLLTEQIGVIGKRARRKNWAKRRGLSGALVTYYLHSVSRTSCFTYKLLVKRLGTYHCVSLIRDTQCCDLRKQHRHRDGTYVNRRCWPPRRHL